MQELASAGWETPVHVGEPGYSRVVNISRTGCCLLFTACLQGSGTSPDEHGPVHRCIEAYGVVAGYDFVSDGWHSECPELSESCESLSVAEAEAACASAGQPCGGQIALTRGGAGCVAHEEGLARGVDGVVHADLIYSEAHRRPVWVVSNILSTDSEVASGERLVISAADAVVLDRYRW